jgi:hypothetical protein
MQFLRLFIIFLLFSCAYSAQAQNIDFTKNSSLGNLYIRMYGEVHYYQPLKSQTFDQGQFDAKRIVALFGYQFDRKTQFVTEWELEHANEIFLEQAFIKHRIGRNVSIKAGMILIPMGIINEYHEPNNFYSVDRPFVDKTLVPSTWRDIGVGINGLIPTADLRYQLYLVNGLLGYKEDSGKFNMAQNYRSGRQKGSKTIFSGLPALSGQLLYYGMANSKLGLSVYMGQSNSDAYKGLNRDNETLVASADSTVVFTSMVGGHFSSTFDKWNIKTQLISAVNGNTNAYNQKTGSDLSKYTLGFYTELGRSIDEADKWLVFARYGLLDYALEKGKVNGTNVGLDHIVTFGVNYFAAKGAVFKVDFQTRNLHETPEYSINSGIGVWF